MNDSVRQSGNTRLITNSQSKLKRPKSKSPTPPNRGRNSRRKSPVPHSNRPVSKDKVDDARNHGQSVPATAPLKTPSGSPKPRPSSGRKISPRPPARIGRKQSKSPTPPQRKVSKDTIESSEDHKRRNRSRTNSPLPSHSQQSNSQKHPSISRKSSKSPTPSGTARKATNSNAMVNQPRRHVSMIGIPTTTPDNKEDRLIHTVHMADDRERPSPRNKRPYTSFQSQHDESIKKESLSSFSSFADVGERTATISEEDDIDSLISDLEDDSMINKNVDEEDMADFNLNSKQTLPPPGKRIMSEDTAYQFPHDTWWQKCLRYFRILPPVRNEGKIKRRVRLLIWATLVLDFCVCFVSLVTYGGAVTMCCGTPTMTGTSEIDWNLFMNIIAYTYLVGILLEIIPTVREILPWNLVNPIFGSCLSFAVFVDDSKAEAISIWILELGSVVLEFLTYINLRKLYAREERRLEKLTSSISSYKRDVRERDSELQEMSVKDEYRKNYYLRERRNLRVEHSASQRKLRYHFLGVCVNFTLLGLTLLLIILVARGGGMCKVGGEGLDLFNTDQKGRCNMCIEQLKGEKCELCKDRAGDQVPSEADIIQCYYPYF